MSGRDRLTQYDRLICERTCSDVDTSKVASVIAIQERLLDRALTRRKYLTVELDAVERAIAMREYALELLAAPAEDGAA